MERINKIKNLEEKEEKQLEEMLRYSEELNIIQYKKNNLLK